MVMMIITICAATSSWWMIHVDATNYVLGVLLATDAGKATDVTNARCGRAIQMAMEDYQSGYYHLPLALPSSTNVSIVNYTTLGQTSQAFLAALTAVQVITFQPLYLSIPPSTE
jgi:hypothetical protein